MSRRRGDRLSDEDRRLWQRVAATARPLRPRRPAPPEHSGIPATAPPPGPANPAQPPASLPPEAPSFARSFRPEVSTGAGSVRFPATAPALPVGPTTLARRDQRRLRQGRLAPEARIDLHGLSLDEAHGALARFILSSQARGLRLVLVITGKGRGDEPETVLPFRRGALRRAVPMWLRTPPLALTVIEVSTAHRRHGGEGAFYVRLRRPGK